MSKNFAVPPDFAQTRSQTEFGNVYALSPMPISMLGATLTLYQPMTHVSKYEAPWNVAYSE